MILRQANGNSYGNGATSWSSSGASSSMNAQPSPAAQQPSQTPTKMAKKHSLLEQKRQQWAEERSEQEEWFPFGRPGCGAPLKSPVELFAQQNATTMRRRGTWTPGSRYSDGGGGSLNGSNTDLFTSAGGGGTATNTNGNLPAYCQLNGDNNYVNGHSEQKNSTQETMPLQMGYPNGYFSPSMIVPFHAVPSNFTRQANGMILNSNGAAMAQPIYYAPTLPGAVSTDAGQFCELNRLYAQPVNQPVFFQAPPPQQQQQQFVENPHQNGHTIREYASPSSSQYQSQAIQEPSSSNFIRPSLNPAVASPTRYAINGAQSSASDGGRPLAGEKNTAVNGSLDAGSYTEQWASQLPVWQQQEHFQNPSRPSNLPVQQQYAPVTNNPSTPLIMHPCVQTAAYHATSTPLAQHPQPMAFVTPIQCQTPPQMNGFQNGHTVDGQRVLVPPQQRLAIVSPMHSKAPSLSGNETLDGSSNMQFLSASLSGSLPAIGDDLASHRRRAYITTQKDDREMEERQKKILANKNALEEQMMEKQRKQFIDAERERREIERAERERRMIEQRESLENEHELNKWKYLANEEEKRERAVASAWQRAKDEAQRSRHTSLLKHAAASHHSDSDGYESLSPPANACSTDSREQFTDDRESLPSLISSTVRSQSMPPTTATSNFETPTDDRPIRPMAKDPLKILEEMGYTTVEENMVTPVVRNARGRQSMRAKMPSSKSEHAIPVEKRRASSSDRKRRLAKKDVDETEICSVATMISKDVNENRLKSAGLISNATFIIDSNEKDEVKENDSKQSIRKSRVVTKRTPTKTVEKEAKEEVARPKTPPRNQSVEKPLATLTNENPWGNTLGGLNPLLQPIVTRRRKNRLASSTTSSPQDEKTQASPQSVQSQNDSVAKSEPSRSPAKPVNSILRTRADSLSDVCATTSLNDFSPTKTSENAVSAEKSPEKFGFKPVYTRSPSLDRFNAKSPLYGSISAKMKRPTESQQKLMEQLTLLRQQLKLKQKEVEDGLPSLRKNAASDSSTAGTQL